MLILSLDFHESTHPRMDAALEPVIARAESAHQQLATRREVLSGGALRSWSQSSIEGWNASPAKGGNLCERMPAATLVRHFQGRIELDLEIGGLVPPGRVSNGSRR
jgi:hypothetical protein